MSESRKNHFTVDGGQEKEEEHAASYKPIPESDTEFRPPSKASLTKSREKVSSDGAEEKLLSKEDEAKIATRVDMAEAKYVVGDHRNGDAKIELDANKRQFSGLTKEELLKYADDPFWVRLRWFMFVLFWALWLAMLAGAIAIIIRAPKCYPPAPKTWYELGPLADFSSEEPVNYAELEDRLPQLEGAKVQGVFINPCEETYQVLEAPTCLDKFKAFLEKAKKKSIKLIVDLTANYVPDTHEWFLASQKNATGEFADYFVWGAGQNSVPDGSRPDVPNNWKSRFNEPAWTWNEQRRSYYLHQYRASQPDLNFHNARVVRNFEAVLKAWLAAGADGVRLRKARELLVNKDLTNNSMATEPGAATLADYGFYKHKETSDQPELTQLFARWAGLVTSSGDDKVFTLYEDGELRPEWFVVRNASLALRPPLAAPRVVDPSTNLTKLAYDLHRLSANWSAIQLTSSDATASAELAAFSMLLPMTPLLAPDQLPAEDNATTHESSFARLAELRDDVTIKYGERRVAAVPGADKPAQFLAAARWKPGHTGYLVLFNPGSEAGAANLTALPTVPDSLTIHHLSSQARDHANYTQKEVKAGSVPVPPASALVLSYVMKTVAEK